MQEHPAAKAVTAAEGGAAAAVEGEDAGGVMTRSSLECGCMRRWVVQIEGVAHRFCSGCKLYHVLSFFAGENDDASDQSGKKPSKVCTWFKERRKQRTLEAAEGKRKKNAEEVAIADGDGDGDAGAHTGNTALLGRG